jgi:hypothetical protein
MKCEIVKCERGSGPLISRKFGSSIWSRRTHNFGYRKKGNTRFFAILRREIPKSGTLVLEEIWTAGARGDLDRRQMILGTRQSGVRSLEGSVCPSREMRNRETRERIWTVDPEEIWTVDLVPKGSQFRGSEEGEHLVLCYPEAQIPEIGSSQQLRNANSRYNHSKFQGYELQENSAIHSSNNVKCEVKKRILVVGCGPSRTVDLIRWFQGLGPQETETSNVISYTFNRRHFCVGR